jgi:GTP-binding protein HflX
VELAQLQYLLPRLAGSGAALSRLGGGIGTRGPGETKLETDRRRIRQRIASLQADIDDVKRRRSYVRTRRRRSQTPTVALVGYTNAGKTTLFNLLTGAEAEASHALFVTLDPVVRRLKSPGARSLRLSDTVGFIDRLPHQLVAAFHGTLEEVAGADLLVHVIDAAAPDRQRRIDAVRAVLGEVGAGAVPSIDLYNKIDLMPAEDVDRRRAGDPAAVLLSARTAAGREQLLEAIAAHLHVEDERITLELDAEGEADRRLVNALYRHGKVISHLTEEGRVTIEADVPRRLLGRFTRDKVPA